MYNLLNQITLQPTFVRFVQIQKNRPESCAESNLHLFVEQLELLNDLHNIDILFPKELYLKMNVFFLKIPSLPGRPRSEEHTSELQSRDHLVCRLLREKKNFS